MSYQVLARKWRPSSFKEMVGQQSVLKGLIHALDKNHLHHAYLFTGTRGVGKTTVARIVAKCLNCEKGVSSTPCNECQTCLEIAQGRFVDLIEIDAASRTKVEDTREILDNVQYAPSRGRYKVYLIDEVHMLSSHSFNALLKTLEEPPEHVKFLLATTDPQKLPITVLSRCLQFHLKNIDYREISSHLSFILGEEKIKFEEPALVMIARAANGSLRDALSLLDQAIAYGEGEVKTASVESMLGVTNQQEIISLAKALAENEALALNEAIHRLSKTAIDYAQVLSALGRLFYEISVVQVLPGIDNLEYVQADLDLLAGLLSPETTQLFYQIVLNGKKDLNYAPDAKVGFEMVLLRMFAFKPLVASLNGTEIKPLAQAKPQTVPNQVAPAVNKPLAESSPKTQQKPGPEAQNWHEILDKLNLTGMTKQLAYNCALIEFEGDRIRLALDEKHAALLSAKIKERLTDAVSGGLGRPIKIEVAVESVERETPAKKVIQKTQEKQQHAEGVIKKDPFIQFMQAEFDAIIDPLSVKPIE